MNKAYVYFIRTKYKQTSRLYIGSTNNLERRIKEHLRYGQLAPGVKGNLCGVIITPNRKSAFWTEHFCHQISKYIDESVIEAFCSEMLFHYWWDEEELNC
jgi:predicted GIY-YIG superfamily endonuclease